MNNKNLLIGTFISALSFGALAETPSFDNVEFGYKNINIEEANDLELSGFELKGSKEINKNFYVSADYSEVSKNNATLTLSKLGGGFKNDISPTTTLYTGVDFALLDNDIDSESGYQLNLGVRSMMTKQLELKAGVEYLDIDDTDTTFLVLGAAFNLTKEFAAYADYRYESDISQYGVGVRYNF